MEIKLDEKTLNIDGDQKISTLIGRVKEELSSTGRRLVGIEIEGELLTQTELNEKMNQKLSGKQIRLVTETTDALADELVISGLSYLKELGEWSEELSAYDATEVFFRVDTEELEGLLEGFHWLNLALEELIGGSKDPAREIVGGRSFAKLISENRMFLSELRKGLESPEESSQLIGALLVRDLPSWIEEYKHIFLDLQAGLRGGHDD